MANKRSAEKRARQAAVRAQRNRAVKSRVKTATRRFNDSLASGGAEAAADALSAVSSVIDKAAKKGVIHRNQANRRKSRLAKKLNGAEKGTA